MPTRLSLRLSAALTLLGLVAAPALAQTGAGDPLSRFIEEGDIILDARLRFEFVDRDGFTKDATALTARARYGFETGALHGFRLLVEGDVTRDLGVNDFNSTVNGKALFPVVADPDSERLNRLQLSWTGAWDGGASATGTVGRQRIKLDNDRFIGNVGFRQNEQTYDAARLQVSPLEGLTVDYAYLWQVNRIFGSKSVNDSAESDSHIIHATYKTGWADVTGYAYLLDLEDSLAGASSQTYGARLVGSRTLAADWRVLYEAEFARQTDFGGAQADFNLDYIKLRGGAEFGGLTVAAQTEWLEGDGNRGFATPLATLHAFQGFADLFLNTPATGIRDIQVDASYRWRDVPLLDKVRLAVWFHDFRSERGGADLGEEIDWGLFITPRKGVTFSLKYADFFGAPGLPDTRRVWASLDLAF